MYSFPVNYNLYENKKSPAECHEGWVWELLYSGAWMFERPAIADPTEEF